MKTPFAKKTIPLFLVMTYVSSFVLISIIGTLRKPRRQRQRERGKTKGLMSRTMALHVYYKTLYISQPFSTK